MNYEEQTSSGQDEDRQDRMGWDRIRTSRMGKDRNRMDIKLWAHNKN